MTAKVLVAGIGNMLLSDDGFGPEVARQLQASRSDLPAGVSVVDYGTRGMHLAYELLDGYDALVLIDTMPGDRAAGDIVVLAVGPADVGQGEFNGHGMDPVTVLGSLEALGGTLPPTFVVGCQPATVEEGIGLSPAVAAAVPAAMTAVRALLADRVAQPDLAGTGRP